jgi:hypothetical protein
LVNFTQKAEIPLIVYSANYKIIFYNNFFKKLFPQNNDISDFIDLLRLEESHKYYSYKQYNKNTVVKLRIDLTLKNEYNYFVTVRIVDYIYKKGPLTNALPISIYTKNDSNIYVDANQYTVSLTKYDTIEGLSAFEVFEQDAFGLANNDQIVISENKGVFYEKIGDIVFLSLKFKHQVKNEIYICGASLNITDIHYKELNKILSSSPSPDIDIDLTRCELRCISQFLIGRTSKDIGLNLKLSQKTVEFHLSNAKKKLDCFKSTKFAYTIGKFHSLFSV